MDKSKKSLLNSQEHPRPRHPGPKIGVPMERPHEEQPESTVEPTIFNEMQRTFWEKRFRRMTVTQLEAQAKLLGINDGEHHTKNVWVNRLSLYFQYQLGGIR